MVVAVANWRLRSPNNSNNTRNVNNDGNVNNNNNTDNTNNGVRPDSPQCQKANESLFAPCLK